MQFIVALALAGATAWLITALASGTLERAVSAFGQLVGGWRSDPWPRGVQEEDRDRPWGWRARSTAQRQAVVTEDTGSAVPTSRLQARTTVR